MSYINKTKRKWFDFLFIQLILGSFTLLQVIKKILDLLPCAPSVREVTLFFDEVFWAVLRRALPDANIRGCVLYWMKAAWKTVSV